MFDPSCISLPLPYRDLIRPHFIYLCRSSPSSLGDAKEGPDAGNSAKACEDEADIASHVGFVRVDHLQNVSQTTGLNLLVRKTHVGSSEAHDPGGDLIGGTGKCHSGGPHTSAGSLRHDAVATSPDGTLVKESPETYEKGLLS